MKQRKQIDQDEYRKYNAVANSTLLLAANNPSDIKWLENAPVDVAKRTAADIGTALHTSLLEPELFESQVYVSSVAGRATKTFEKEIIDNPDKIVLTESEVQQLRLMQASGMAHPAFAKIINDAIYKESSIFVHDEARGIDLKIRPDIDSFESEGYLANLKTTANLADWRADRYWLNPLHKFNYGHDAAYSLYVASIFYGEDCEVYKYPVLQKSVSLGRYPVGVFTITKQRLISEGFWDEMLRNLDTYAKCYHQNAWLHEEQFPSFDGDGVEIEEVE